MLVVSDNSPVRYLRVLACDGVSAPRIATP
jgi:hypothetical protein